MSGNIDQDSLILEQLFDGCDGVSSGLVKTVSLVNAIKLAWFNSSDNSEREVKLHLTELTRCLDPRSDNGYVDRETFIKIGKTWFDNVRKTSNNNASLSTSSLASESLHDLQSPPAGSLDKKPSADFNATFNGSIEAINGVSFSGGKTNYIELVEEIEELRKQIKIMHDEKTKLTNQVMIVEDSSTVIQSQNGDLQQRLKNTKVALDNALKYQNEYENLKTAAQTTEEECSNLQGILVDNNSRVFELQTKNADILSQLDDTRDQLNDLQHELCNVKKGNAENMELLVEEQELVKSKWNESIAINLQLEGRIEALQSDLSFARESQFFQKTPPIFETGDSDLFGASFDEMDPFSVKQEHKENEGPVAYSTPFHGRVSRARGMRGSIGDEIKMLGVQGSPLCEKSILHNVSKVEMADASTQTPTIDGWIGWAKSLGWRVLAAGSGFAFFILVMAFTFFGAVQIGDGRTLMPILWSPNFGLPEPIALISLRDVPPSVW